MIRGLSKNDSYKDKKKLMMILLIFICVASANNMILITILASVQLISSILILKFLDVEIISLPVIFLILSYIFNMGTLVLRTLSIHVDIPFNPYTMFSKSIFYNSCKFYILAEFFLVLGMLIVSKAKSVKLKSDNKFKNDMSFKLKKKLALKIGIIALCIGIVPRLYIDIGKVILYIHGGYLATYDLKTFGSILPIVGKLAQVGIMLIIIASKDNLKRARTLLFITIGYEVFSMLSGNRIFAIVYILTLIYAYFKFVESITKGKAILIVIGGYLGLIFINIIGIVREGSFSSIFIGGNLIKIITKSPIWGMLANFGGTLVSLSYSMLFFPADASYNYGKTYLSAPLILIPFITKIFPGLNKQFIFLQNFPGDNSRSLGGSYLGELYFNFGFIIGAIAAIIIGIGVMYAHNKAMQYWNERAFIKFTIMMVIFQQILMWVRSYFSSGLRNSVYLIALLVLIYIIVDKKLIYKFKRGYKS